MKINDYFFDLILDHVGKIGKYFFIKIILGNYVTQGE